ncbi:FAD-dependent monooxygenase [Kutzneria sp. NPDC052558]|uniref:FAD-dependent monooxygenase n=1 Tax=Kutzneria sp. NPDC052558 TaxID=3364121 RepID=UPI0037C7CBBF
MRVLVTGGGIGGLATAVALRQAGADVHVVEKAKAFGEVGAGVQLGPNATGVLRRLGLGDELDEVGFAPEHLYLLRWQDGAHLAEFELANRMLAEYGSPYYTLYRPDLIDILSSALPDEVTSFGVPVTGVHPDKPAITLADGRTLDADLVVGADGTHSIVRGATVGDAPARFSGMCGYRAMMPIEPGEDLNVQLWLGPDRHVVAYPVGRGPNWINMLCVVPEPDWHEESWTAPGTAEDLRAHFDGWSSKLTGLLDRVTEPVYRWALYDREPLTHWSTATTTLLGDAAHPMLPFLAQGAAQSIEDAAALASVLDDDLPAMLKAYEDKRRVHTARVQRMSWDNNVVYHLADGAEQRKRDADLAAGDGFHPYRMTWLYGSNPF